MISLSKKISLCVQSRRKATRSSQRPTYLYLLANRFYICIAAMHAFLQAIHDTKAIAAKEQATVMPLLDRVRLRAKMTKCTRNQDLQGRASDIHHFLKEIYGLARVTSMNVKEIVPRMLQSLDFIYTADQAKTMLILFARTSPSYDLTHHNHYIRCTAFFSLFFCMMARTVFIRNLLQSCLARCRHLPITSFLYIKNQSFFIISERKKIHRMIWLVIYLLIFCLCVRILFVVWPSLALINPLPLNDRRIPTTFDFIKPGTIILTKIGASPFSVNHISLALSHDRIFECMTTRKKKAQYHFFRFQTSYILPRLIHCASAFVVRQPIQPLSADDVSTLDDLSLRAINMDFNGWYEVDIFRHRIFGTRGEENVLAAAQKRKKAFCTQYVSLMLQSIHRINVEHTWSLPSEFSSLQSNDVLRNHYTRNATISEANQ